MKFQLSVIDATSGSATGDETAAIDAFHGSLRVNWHWVIAARVSVPAAALTVDNHAGAGLVTEGPFLRSDE